LLVQDELQGVDEFGIKTVILLDQNDRVLKLIREIFVQEGVKRLNMVVCNAVPTWGNELKPPDSFTTSKISEAFRKHRVGHIGNHGMVADFNSCLIHHLSEVVATRCNLDSFGFGFHVRLEDIGLPLEILLLRRHLLDRKGTFQSRIGPDVLAEGPEVHLGLVALIDEDPVVDEGGHMYMGIVDELVDDIYHMLRFEILKPYCERVVLPRVPLLVFDVLSYSDVFDVVGLSPEMFLDGLQFALDLIAETRDISGDIELIFHELTFLPNIGRMNNCFAVFRKQPTAGMTSSSRASR
jgi:hypothetical protein